MSYLQARCCQRLAKGVEVLASSMSPTLAPRSFCRLLPPELRDSRGSRLSLAGLAGFAGALAAADAASFNCKQALFSAHTPQDCGAHPMPIPEKAETMDARTPPLHQSH